MNGKWRARGSFQSPPAERSHGTPLAAPCIPAAQRIPTAPCIPAAQRPPDRVHALPSRLPAPAPPTSTCQGVQGAHAAQPARLPSAHLALWKRRAVGQHQQRHLSLGVERLAREGDAGGSRPLREATPGVPLLLLLATCRPQPRTSGVCRRCRSAAAAAVVVLCCCNSAAAAAAAAAVVRALLLYPTSPHQVCRALDSLVP